MALFYGRGELTSEDSVNWVRVRVRVRARVGVGVRVGVRVRVPVRVRVRVRLGFRLGLGLGLGHSSENGLPLFYMMLNLLDQTRAARARSAPPHARYAPPRSFAGEQI